MTQRENHTLSLFLDHANHGYPMDYLENFPVNVDLDDDEIADQEANMQRYEQVQIEKESLAPDENKDLQALPAFGNKVPDMQDQFERLRQSLNNVKVKKANAHQKEDCRTNKDLVLAPDSNSGLKLECGKDSRESRALEARIVNLETDVHSLRLEMNRLLIDFKAQEYGRTGSLLNGEIAKPWRPKMSNHLSWISMAVFLLALVLHVRFGSFGLWA